MSRKRALALTAVGLGVLSAGLAFWASSTYRGIEMEQGFYYTLIGYSAAQARILAAADAAAAIGMQSTLAWVLLAAAIAAVIAAIAIRPDTPAPVPTTAPIADPEAAEG